MLLSNFWPWDGGSVPNAVRSVHNTYVCVCVLSGDRFSDDPVNSHLELPDLAAPLPCAQHH